MLIRARWWVLLGISVPVIANAAEPRTATLRTAYGNIQFQAITVFGKNPNAECGVSADIKNETDIVWNSPVFVFTFSGLTEDRQRALFRVRAPLIDFEQLLAGSSMSGLWGLCIADYPSIDIDRITVAMEAGTADPETVAKHKSAVAAKLKAEAERRRLEAGRRAEREALATVCKKLHAETADRKISDLTVRETAQVQACQAAGLYWQK